MKRKKYVLFVLMFAFLILAFSITPHIFAQPEDEEDEEPMQAQPDPKAKTTKTSTEESKVKGKGKEVSDQAQQKAEDSQKSLVGATQSESKSQATTKMEELEDNPFAIGKGQKSKAGKIIEPKDNPFAVGKGQKPKAGKLIEPADNPFAIGEQDQMDDTQEVEVP